MTEHVATQREFLKTELQPTLDAAQAGNGHVFFVDAAHFVFGTFLCSLWSIARIFVRAASGRQRFNVLGAWNAISRQLLTVTNTTVENTDTMCDLLRKIATQKLTGPITHGLRVKTHPNYCEPLDSVKGLVLRCAMHG